MSSDSTATRANPKWPPARLEQRGVIEKLASGNARWGFAGPSSCYGYQCQNQRQGYGKDVPAESHVPPNQGLSSRTSDIRKGTQDWSPAKARAWAPCPCLNVKPGLLGI